MYEYATKIKMRDADAAGVLFFGRYFALAHDAYEAFLDAHGVNIGQVLLEGGFLLPVVHAESDYRAPLFVGEAVTIQLRVVEIRTRAFTVAYEFHNSEDKVACTMKTIHVPVDPKTKRSAPIPEAVVRALENAVEKPETP
jgi:1,4-dihydroxy-2-naphthoyl-CoA hydrolase